MKAKHREGILLITLTVKPINLRLITTAKCQGLHSTGIYNINKIKN